MKKVAVIGAGTMGSSIAQRLAQNRLSVVLVDIGAAQLRQAMDRIRGSLEGAIVKGLMDRKEADEVTSRIDLTTEIERAAKVDLAIETVFEDERAKASVLKVLDKTCSRSAIIATNTSAMSIDMLAAHTCRKDRFLGMHFFYPATMNRLVEIIPGKGTSTATLDVSFSLVRRLGMVPITARDSPGFAVNRLFVPWLNEATRIVEEFVADIPTVDAVAKEAFGITMGPFELMNATGIAIARHSMSSFIGLGHFYAPSNFVVRHVKTGKPWDLCGRPNMARADVVRRRLYGVIFQEACALLDGKIARLEDIERGARIGLRWALGPFGLMNRLGTDAVKAHLNTFYDRHSYIRPPTALKEWLAEGKPWRFHYIDARTEGRIARIVVNRPEAMNAMNDVVLGQLEQRFVKADKDPHVKAIVLEGVGKAFMAGADLGFFVDRIENGRIDEIIELTRRAHRLAKRIDSSRKLVIAKLDGVAMGGGAELALVADVIVASERAKIGFPETGIGLYPGLGGTQRLPRLIGKELAKYLIMTGRILDVETAVRLGLVQYSVPSDKIEDFVVKLTKRKSVSRLGPVKRHGPEWTDIKKRFSDKRVKTMLSGEAPETKGKAPLALRLLNELIDKGLEKGLDEGLELELAHLGEIFSTKDALTGLRSVGKARPVFEGR